MNLITDPRPWGVERWLTNKETSTVKLLYVNAGQSLSLQVHNHRDEFWKVISGNPEIVVGDKTYTANPNDEITVPAKTAHRISSPNGDVVILEISTGDFDENDEIRLEDNYNRS